MSREDMNEVLDDGVQTAIHFLQKSGEFFPFGVFKLRREATPRHIYAWDGKDVRPESGELIDKLRLQLRRSLSQSEIICSAIISDVQFKDMATGVESDAIRAEIESGDSGSIVCFLPYRISNSQVEIGEIVAQQGNSVASDEK